MAYRGKFVPKNPTKYSGNAKNIVWRSTWEARVMKWMDTNPAVISWASEEVIVKYINPFDRRSHRYFPDFVAQIRDSSNNINTIMIEVKPEIQTRRPKVVSNRKTKKRSDRYRREVITYAINQAKWAAAKNYCSDHGWKFQVLTEHELGIK